MTWPQVFILGAFIYDSKGDTKIASVLIAAIVLWSSVQVMM